MPAVAPRPADGAEFECPSCQSRWVFRTSFHKFKAVAFLLLFPALIVIRMIDGIGWAVLAFVIVAGSAFVYYVHRSERFEPLNAAAEKHESN
jgi:hypothetical protein